MSTHRVGAAGSAFLTGVPQRCRATWRDGGWQAAHRSVDDALGQSETVARSRGARPDAALGGLCSPQRAHGSEGVRRATHTPVHTATHERPPASIVGADRFARSERPSRGQRGQRRPTPPSPQNLLLALLCFRIYTGVNLLGGLLRLFLRSILRSTACVRLAAFHARAYDTRTCTQVNLPQAYPW